MSNKIEIKYSGLKLGNHQFYYTLDNIFFEEFQNEEILGADIKLKVEIEKHDKMLEVSVDWDGYLVMPCDICCEDLKVKAKGTQLVVVKINDFIVEDDDDEIINVLSSDYKVDITNFVYDSIILSIPLRKVHGEAGEGECDKDIIEIIEKYRINNNYINNN